jgi:hypothetical protein
MSVRVYVLLREELGKIKLPYGWERRNDKDWKRMKLGDVVYAVCCNHQGILSDWDCGCSWGSCDACEYSWECERCGIIRHRFKEGMVKLYTEKEWNERKRMDELNDGEADRRIYEGKVMK